MSKNRFKYRAWNKIEKKMYTGLPYSGAGKDGHDTFDIVLKFPGVYEVSECANVYDSENVLVYEGDYLSDGETIWEVVYCETMSGFSAKAVGGQISSDCRRFSLYHLCNGHNAGRKVHVVGNKYEYKGAISNLLDKSQTLIKRYRCIKEITFDCCDGEGFLIENKFFTIPVGSIWQETPYMISGGKDNVHLDREDVKDQGQWCEPLKETFREYFEEIEPLVI